MSEGVFVRISRVIAALAAVVATSVGFGVPASAESGTATLVVNIARDDSQNITNGCLYVQRAAYPFTKVATDCSLSDGVMTASGLAPGDYMVRAEQVSGTFAYLNYPDIPGYFESGEPVTLTADTTTTIDFSLPTTTTVTGTVQTPELAPAGGGTVTLLGDGLVPVASTEVGGDGTYELKVPIGSHHLRVSGFPGMADMYYGPQYMVNGNGVTYLDQRTLDVVLPPIVLRPASRIVGTLLSPIGALDGEACARVKVRDGSTAYGPPVCGEVGDPMAIPVVPGFSYELCLYDPLVTVSCDGNYYDEADEVGGETVSLGFEVPLAGGDIPITYRFGGTVVATASIIGSPEVPTGGCAYVQFDHEEVARSCDNVNGTFTIDVPRDQRSASAYVLFSGLEGARDGSVSLGYDTYLSNGSTKSVSFAAEPWAAVKGTVTRPTGHSATTVCVGAFDAERLERSVCIPPGTSTYRLPVPPGKYQLQFYTVEPGVAFEWFDNKTDWQDAKWVVVGTSSVTANATLAVSGRVAGVVTDNAGNPASGGCVQLIGEATSALATVCGVEGGHYAIESVPPGTYRLRFGDFSGLADEWYDDSLTGAGAKRITITAGATTTANAQLGPESRLLATVEFEGEDAGEGCVEAVDTAGVILGTDCDPVDGEFEIGNLPAVSARVYYSDFDGAANVWHGGSPSFAGAETVSLQPEGATAIAWTLAPGGSISGGPQHNTEDTATGDVWVDLYTPSGDFVASARMALEDGRPAFRFDHVAAGDYKIRFGRTRVASGDWYRTSGSISPSVVTVGSAQDVTGIRGSYRNDGEYGGYYGYLNVPTAWTNSTVCAVLLSEMGKPLSADCGKRGALYQLDGTEDGGIHSILFTNGKVTTAAQVTAFKGATTFLGNTTNRELAPHYGHPGVGRVAYLPTWFFSDVTYKNSAFFEISWMGDTGISTGYPDGSYKPNGKVIRQDMARFLYRLAGSPDVVAPDTSPFLDVAASNSAYSAIYWLKQQGITTVNPFEPKDNVTRRQMALFMYRMAGEPSVTLPSKSPFKDVKKTDSAYKAMVWMKKEGISTGYADGTYRPNEHVLRGHMAMFMFRYADAYP